jgi:hypothetical protein
MVGTGVSAAIALFVVKPVVDLPFWLGLVAFGVMLVIGGIVGRFVGGLLSRPPSGGAQNPPPRA